MEYEDLEKMNRKQRRNFAKINRLPWEAMPKFTEESNDIRKASMPILQGDKKYQKMIFRSRWMEELLKIKKENKQEVLAQ